MAKFWIITAGILGAVAVSIGAYHAHGLEKLLKTRYEDALGGAEYLQKDGDRLYRKGADKDQNDRMDGAEIEAEIKHLLHNTESAVNYQFFHTLAILAVGILMLFCDSRRLLGAAAALMLLGVLGFSGGIYLVVFDIARALHWIIPIGGVLLIVGWVVLAVAGAFVGDNTAPDAPSN